jgi:hypothetical protein
MELGEDAFKDLELKFKNRPTRGIELQPKKVHMTIE